MLREKRTRRAAVAGLGVLILVGAGGCGQEERPEAAAKSRPAAHVDPNKHPYAITCGDLADPLAAADMSRRATVKLARKADISGLSQLRASQSIFFAMTELCKENDASYTPAEDAVAAVKRGEYRADLGAP
jgi:hypothetical protein